jgi:phosphatidylglycerol lysyltransferase
VVPAFALAVFAAGAMLLVTGAIPLGAERRDLVASFVPLSILELSHLSASLLGVLLLVLARGLYLKLDAAWAIALLALVAASVTSFFAGFHWEQALLLAAIALPLWTARRRFYRPASLFDEPFTWGWARDIALVVTGAIWIGFFAHQHVEYADRHWWDFAFDSDAPRMLRASLAAVSLLIGLGLYKLLRPAAEPPAVASAQELERARALIGADTDSSAHLALVGDKQLLFAEGPDEGFLMFQRAGGSLVAMADPVGTPDARRALIWKFRETADLQGLRPVFYQVSDEHLADYIDLGLVLTKLGEEAIVDLESFSLEGRERADLRSALRKAAKENIAFEVLSPAQVAAEMEALERVSQEWLATREAAEKGFSVGYFDREYLTRFPCAVARRGAEIVAFANLWPCAARGELSVDLMRYADAAPPGIMDFLLSQVMLWGKANGYACFSLGMAPLAGLSRHRLAPSWHKLGDFIWRHGGAFYHFEGLRRYKQKYKPQWRPRYLASPGGLNLPRALIDVMRLIAGGTRAVFRK